MAKTYNADEVDLIIAGVPIDAGFADGEFLRIEQESDDFGDVVGTDGEVTRFKTLDRRANVVVLLMQTSDSNQFLSALSNADRLLPNGGGIVPFLVLDTNGASLYEALELWVQKPPDVSFAREPGTREWNLRVARLERNDAGT